MQEIAFTSFILGALANLILLIFVFINWQKQNNVLLLSIALISTIVWCTLLALNTRSTIISGLHFLPIESIRHAIWIFLFIYLTKQKITASLLSIANILNILILLCITIVSIANANGFILWDSEDSLISQIILLLIVQLVIGIYSLENLYYGTQPEHRKSLKLFCFALLLIFIYDLAAFSYLLLFEDIHLIAWALRGFAAALCIPLITLTIIRNPHWSLDIFISRQVITTSFALLLTSIYLAALVFSSIFVKSISGNFGDFFIALIIFIGLICLALVSISKNIRNEFSVFINKHFFKNKYDYRIEWLKLINTISNNKNLPELNKRIIKVLVDLTQTSGGLLWQRDSQKNFKLSQKFNLSVDGKVSISSDEAFIKNLSAGEVVIFDCNTKNHFTQIPKSLEKINDLWLAIPLIHEDNLEGFVALDKLTHNKDPNWEDLDIFKTVGKQLASYLMENKHAGALSVARQFEAYHQTTTFIIHDLRNLLSQQSLLVENAAKHKNNPAFIDDMIETIDNSVTTLRKLTSNLHADKESTNLEYCTLNKVIEKCRNSFHSNTCILNFRSIPETISLNANENELAMQINHLLRNAEQANSSTIDITIDTIDDEVELVIKDNGEGMDSTFIDNKLFKPFFSTKGAAGMGIGAYEVRKYIEKLGGDIKVRSDVNQGTEFTLTLPLAAS